MQIEKPAAINEKNLTTDVNLEVILKLRRKRSSATTMRCSNLESERTHSQTPNLIRRAFFKSNRRQIIMKSERFKNSAVLLLAAIVAGCSQIAVVSEKPPRSEERRVGKECRSRMWREYERK